MKTPLTPDIDFPAGYVLNIDKPLGWTSTDVVRKVRFMLRRCGYRKIKVGHAGTLDPLATGVLLVCIGKATKRVDELQAGEKEYVAAIRLGATTPSGDLEHEVDRTFPYEHITREKMEEALRSLEGERLQAPPIYSAKKVEGQRAYEYAREGVDVELRKSLITIRETELLEFEPPHTSVRIVCSKGTYIRSFATEVGEALESGGHLTALRRTRSGDNSADDAHTIDEIEAFFKALKGAPGEGSAGDETGER